MLFSVLKCFLEHNMRQLGENPHESDMITLGRVLCSHFEHHSYSPIDWESFNYGLFVSGFLLNISGHDESNPVRANKALVAYNQFMAALNEGNVSRANEILDANTDLMGSLPKRFGGDSTDISHK